MSATTHDQSTEPSGHDRSALGLRGAFDAYIVKVKGGDVGALPALLGMAALFIVFTIAAGSTFTNPFNVANLIFQASAITVIAMGLVFVLLLGEIDLSAGFAGGTAAAVMGVVMTRQDQPWPLALLAALLTGAAIGLGIGLLVARLGVPSFVVTLAAFLAFQGALLIIIGAGGTIPYRDATILAVMNKNLPVWLGWLLAVIAVASVAALSVLRMRNRRKQGLPADSVSLMAVRLTVMAVVIFGFTAYLSQERSRNPALSSLKGLPVVVVVVAVLLVLLTLLLNRTAWGRHVYAVGGNEEAARRAGINVVRIKIACFVICSTLAAVGGILLASRTNSVSPTTGGELTLLYAVGAAVIGGTSLFGGKGRVLDAVLGALVVMTIDNGMTLLRQPAGRVYIITGLVLLLAASVDAISRKRAATSGRK